MLSKHFYKDTQTNGFIRLDGFVRFYRFTSLYLEFDPLGTCNFLI
jgi:hypothetical protein